MLRPIEEDSAERHPAAPLIRLRDLEWPEEPDEALWDDPLNAHEIKPLRSNEYEAIG